MECCPAVKPDEPSLVCTLPWGHRHVPQEGHAWGLFRYGPIRSALQAKAKAGGAYVTPANQRNGELADSDEWSTPKPMFDRLNRAFGPFTLDGAASRSNHLCPEYLTKANDAPRLHVGTHRVWLNAPYSRGNLDRFMRWALVETVRSAPVFCCLVPMYTAEAWWQDNVWAPKLDLGVRHGITEEEREGFRFVVRQWARVHIWVHPIAGRVKFVEASGATGPARFSSAIVVYERP